RNITSAWAACGLFLLNPDRVLRKTPKPPPQLTVPRAHEVEVGLYPQDEVLQTPVTPVTADALMSLHNMIKQDTSTLTETSMPRLQRHVQKLANAGQRSIAYCALLDERNSVLTSLNNEAKVRRSTKSVVLGRGQGKVMSFEDIKEARAKRAAKDAMKGKGKGGRKRKMTALEANEPEAEAEPEPEVAHAAKEPEPEVAQTIEAQELWRAPVACMY
ncbi:hypothetical protein BGZ57DRAFT_774677, partial [Hyaloscypha finlandica]